MSDLADEVLPLAELNERLPGHERFTWAGTRFTRRRVDNFVLNNREKDAGATTLESFPWKLTIESTNICNLRCKACFTGQEEVGRSRGHMPLELFSRTLEELGPYLFELEMHNWGEPLLGKHVFEMLEMAHAAGISTSLCTNFSIPFDEARAERLVKSGLTLLGVSLDGARQESYEQYRVRGDIELVLRNAKMVTDAKKRLGSRTPFVIWDFHIFAHNVDDIELARAKAAELGMAFAANKGWVNGEPWDPEDKYKSFLNPFPSRCHFLWHQAVLNHDGGASPCCGTFYPADDVARMALVAEDGGLATFAEAWNSPKLREARRLYESRTGDELLKKSICYNCPSTIIWERYKEHISAGGDPKTFQVGYNANDCWNFFWEFHKTGAGELIPLRLKGTTER